RGVVRITRVVSAGAVVRTVAGARGRIAARRGCRLEAVVVARTEAVAVVLVHAHPRRVPARGGRRGVVRIARAVSAGAMIRTVAGARGGTAARPGRRVEAVVVASAEV